MRIALTAPLSFSLGDKAKGGAEAFVYALAKQLTNRNHHVDVFTVSSSDVSGNKRPIYRSGIRDNVPLDLENARHIAHQELAGAYKTFDILKNEIDQYDIVHNNCFDFYSIIKTSAFKQGLTTLHIPRQSFSMQLALAVDPSIVHGNYVAVSQYQQTTFQDFDHLTTIHNGIDLSQLNFSSQAQQELVWLGRFDPVKGAREAVELAISTNLPLKLAGTQWNQAYFQEVEALIKPQSNISYVGPAGPTLRNQLFGNARAFLYPHQWDEPFGLVFAEAMACGTPIITYDRGAASEIVLDGKTGFVCPVNDTAAMEQAIKRIMSMPEAEYQVMRQACRQRVEQFFTIERMVADYEKIYQQIAQKS